MIALFVLSLLLVGYSVWTESRLRRERVMADLGRAVIRAGLINQALRRKVAEAKGMTQEEFEKSWGR